MTVIVNGNGNKVNTGGIFSSLYKFFFGETVNIPEGTKVDGIITTDEGTTITLTNGESIKNKSRNVSVGSNSITFR